jgi:hypothetical protein
MAESTETSFDPVEWARMGFGERVRLSCRAFVQGGIGYPPAVYIFHAVKLVFFILGWMFFCSFTPGMGRPADFGSWAFEGIAFQKAFIWATLVEVAGFGCTSGPLGGRFSPPFTAFLHFLRPGTVKLAPFPRLPFFGGHERTWLDVALYAAFLLALARALIVPEIEASHLIPIVLLLPLCGLGDKTILLAARVEHHFAMLVCFLFAGEWIAASKWVQLAIWFWAGVSKLTVAFPYVVPIMTANNPMLKSQFVRQKLFVSPPEDVSPSLLARVMAHAGGFLEFAAPLTLVFVTGDGPLLYLGLFWVVMLHGFILSNVPIAAVFEWNVLSVYSGFFLFFGHPEISLFAVGSVPVTLYLVGALFLLPLIGNLRPSRVSFLVAMRYYAGNWAWNAWLFEGDSYKKLDCFKRAAPLSREQLEATLSPEDALRTDATIMAFRTMHLQGRVLGLLLPKALGDRPYQDYTYVDGENVAATLLGWNFGEGHLADERLLAIVQEHCSFEEGELRTICVEAQPLLGSSLHWRVVDAKAGQIDEGHAELSELAKRDPWAVGEESKTGQEPDVGSALGQ